MISRLKIENVRNLKPVDIKDLSRVNIFFGENGSGKTSVLEALHILSLGRSFNSPKIKPVINYNAKECLVYGSALTPSGGLRPIGITRGVGGGFEARVDGSSVSRVSELAKETPLLVVSASSFSVLGGAPATRRQFLDWGLFHVEQGFFLQWRRLQRALKQRNICLRRDSIDYTELQAWTAEFAEAGEAVNGYRESFVQRFSLVFSKALKALSDTMPDVSLGYFRGWVEKDKELTLLGLLNSELKGDVDRGFSRMGPHRADLKVNVSGYSAADVLSRGQQKLVVLALLLAQGEFLKSETGVRSIYLLDDLPSELDSVHLGRVCSYLGQLGSQVFITAVEKDAILSAWHELKESDRRMFHVEHGAIICTV